MKMVIFCWLGLLGFELVDGQGLSEARRVSFDSLAATVMGAPLSHPIRVAAGGIELECRGLYVYHGLLWLSFRGSNRSAIDFRADPVRVFIRDRRTIRRRAVQEMWLRPVFRKEVPVLASGGEVGFCEALVPRVPGRGQEMVVEWTERNGDRRVQLMVRGKRVWRAVRLN